jgi:DNA polymerase I-like protein with 3'-5' exonuclease and polymerase domains
MQDTVLPAKLSDPLQSGSDADGLKELAADVLKDRAVTTAANEARKALFASGKWLTNTGALTPRERSGWAQVDPSCETMIRYAASDVLDTAALPAALPRPDPEIASRESAVQRICARVSHRGLRLDGDHVHELIRVHEEGRDEAGARVREHGIDTPGSTQQVGQALDAMGAELPRTKTGRLSATAAVLDGLAKDDTDIAQLARDVLAYREHATILGLTLEPFRLLCDRGDGRVRPVIYTLGTSTGRMSCVRPNLQQIKRTGDIRACITADEGMTLISADFAGVELRVAAALSGDEALRGFIAEEDAARDTGEKVGLHWKAARQVFGANATKENRYAIKRAVFGHIYGGSAQAMAVGAGISLADAEAVKKALSELTPQLMTWSASWSDAVRAGTAASYLTWGGRTIWFDRRAPHKAGNYAIQGTARELLCAALLEWERTTRWGNSVILPVHDEIVSMVPAAEAEEATAALVRCMETSLYGVPIVAEPSEPAFAWQDAS